MTTTPSRKSKSEAWIGLVHVKPGHGHEWQHAGIGGAYAATVALASSGDEFLATVDVYLRTMNLVVVEAEDVEPMRVRLHDGAPDDALKALASALTDSQPVGLTVFDTYPRDDNDDS